MTTPVSSVYGQVKDGLRNIGYFGGLLREEYQFADVLGQIYSVCSIPLAAFAQEPPSYRNACFGAVISDGDSGAPLVSAYRSLGAPQVLEIRQDEIYRWKMTAQGPPQLVESVSAEHLSGFFSYHKSDWSPDQMLRAKCLTVPEVAPQLDFYDIGLLPVIDTQVQEKLDQLLRRTVAQALEEFRRSMPASEPDYPGLIRLLFRLIAAKILGDRNYEGNWIDPDPAIVIQAVEDFYFRETTPNPVLEHRSTQIAAWESIREAFHFQNLSVEALTYVYENTFVSKELRKLYSIHGTPPAMAEYIVRHLPFEELEAHEQVVFEPFAGHAVFLVAAMRRLRELLPSSMNAKRRHEYFIERLLGLEKDEFAWEVGRLSLMLADYPNPDGWQLRQGDAFLDSAVDREIAKAGVVLCNPPFEDFSFDERKHYSSLRSVHKPAEILTRIVEHPQKPKLLGFVLPRTFLTGRGYRELRALVSQAYSHLELVALPDKVFRHSDAESVLLIASGKPSTSIHIVSALVQEEELKEFQRHAAPRYRTERNVPSSTVVDTTELWERPLSEVWKILQSYDCLGNIAEVHRGIEYNISLRGKRDVLVALQPQENFREGLNLVRDTFEPFVVRDYVYMNTSIDLMRTNAYLHPWDKPKVIANATRLSRGPWRIAAIIDDSGLVCAQYFHGIWALSEIPLEVIATLLNSPIANAYLWSHESRSNRKVTIESIPIPHLTPNVIEQITKLVKSYIIERQAWLAEPLRSEVYQQSCHRLLDQIDAELLKAYDLPPKLERELLDCFRGRHRPGPVEFTEYYPRDFIPFIPWHKYISPEFERARAKDTLARLPVINDPTISTALSELE